mmetsp:Transcript_27163/g.66058  ORF Transcript_27163/g.66058 Transcript_27163/m.66058 type:complete len:184 (+) Transcript_27163:325-876(+)
MKNKFEAARITPGLEKVVKTNERNRTLTPFGIGLGHFLDWLFAVICAFDADSFDLLNFLLPDPGSLACELVPVYTALHFYVAFVPALQGEAVLLMDSGRPDFCRLCSFLLCHPLPLHLPPPPPPPPFHRFGEFLLDMSHTSSPLHRRYPNWNHRRKIPDLEHSDSQRLGLKTHHRIVELAERT